MKFVGIIKEYEYTSSIKIGRSIAELRQSSEEPKSLVKIINYLENGVIIMPFSRYVSDEEGGPQVPLIYYTDGRWIWVSYLTFFLKKGYYSLLSEEFIKSIGQNNFVIPTLDDGNKVEAIRYYYSIYHPELLKDDDLKD